MKRCIRLIPILAFCITFTANLQAQDPPIFENDILPIFEVNCTGCHGADDPQAGFNAEKIAAVMKGGVNGAAVIPGKSDESRLFRMITGQDEKKMPPEPLLPLTDEEIALIKKWIDTGTSSINPPREEEPKNDQPDEKTEPAKEEKTEEPKKEEVKEEKKEEPKPQPEAKTETAPRKAVTAPAGEYDDSQIGSTAFNPKEPALAVGRLYEVQIFNIKEDNQLELLAVLPGHSHLVRSVAFSPDGKTLAAAGGRPAVQGEIVLWDLEKNEEKLRITSHFDNIYDVAFSPDGSKLASCSYDRLIKIWDTADGKELHTLKDHVDAVYDVEFSPNGKRLASVAGDRTLKIWDVESGKRLYTLSDAQKELYTVSFHPSGERIAAGGVDKTIRIWQLGETGGSQVDSKFAHEGAVLRVKYSPDGSLLYSTAEDQLIKAWDTETFLEKFVTEKQPDWTFGMALNDAGDLLAAGRYDGSLTLYNAANGSNLIAAATPKEEPKPAEKQPEAPKVAAAPQPEKVPAKTEEKPETTAAEEEFDDNVFDVSEIIDTEDPFLVGTLVPTGTYPSFLSSISPKVVKRGEKITFKITGKNLNGAELLPDHPDIHLNIVNVERQPIPKYTRPEGNTGTNIVDVGRPYTLTVEAEFPESVNTGFHSLRARTELATTNTQSFLIEDRDATDEKEGNDTPAEAQAVELPGILAGSMNKFGDTDHFSFDAKAGDELVFQVIAGGLGSGLNSSLQILSPDGAALADSAEFGMEGDAVLGYRFGSDGKYILRITDTLLRSGGFYRIHVTRRPFITRVFPPGVRRGEETPLMIEGFNLGGQSKVMVNVPADYNGAAYNVPFSSENGSLLRNVSVAVTDHPITPERMNNDTPQNAMRVDNPVTISGFIYDSLDGKDEDYFRFNAKQGEQLIIDVAAQRFGSPLDSKIEVLQGDGSPIETATVRSVAETIVTLADRDSRSGGIRLDSWKDLEINDYMMLGTEIIRIAGLPDYPDEDISFRSNRRLGWRYGYFGTTPSHHAVNTKAYKVQVHPPGSEFPPNGMPVQHLYAVNDDGGAPIYRSDSYLVFDPPKDGEYLVKIYDALGNQGPNHAYQLNIRPPKPDFNFYVFADRININKDGRETVTVAIDRIDGFDGEVAIDVPNLPDGFSPTLARILPGEESAAFSITAMPGAQSTDPSARFTVNAYAEIGGKRVKKSGSFGAVTVTKQPDIVCTQEPEELFLAPGRTVKVTVKTTRQNGFTGRIPIGVQNLPFGVYVLDTGLNGILITEDETERTFSIYAEPWVEDVSVPIYSTVSVETRSALGNSNATNPSILRITRDPEVLARSSDEVLLQKKKF